MSQLNNRRFNKRIKREDKFTQNIIFTTITICLIFIVITILAINNKSKSNVKEEKNIQGIKETSKLADDGILPVKLTDKYKQNDLKTYEKTYESNYYDFTTENGIIESTPKLEIRYNQIDGLVNKNIENKINEEIKSSVFGMYTEEMLKEENVKKIFINTYIIANYADILSVQLDQIIEYNDDKNEYTSKFLNYALKNGEKIQFKDIFTYNTAIKPIIANSAYESLAWTYNENDMNKVDYSDIENKVYEIIKEYDNTEQLNFGISEKYIYLYFGETNVNIDMSKYSDNIAIYNRYTTYDKIYEYENIGIKNIFVFSSKPAEPYYYFIEDGENYYIDVSIYNEDNVPEEFLEKQKQNLQERVSEIRKTAKNNTDNALLYSGYVYVSANNETNELSVSYELGTYEMTNNYYKETFYNKIGENERADKVDMSFYIDFDETYVKYTNESQELKYDLTTLKEIKEKEENDNNTQSENYNSTNNIETSNDISNNQEKNNIVNNNTENVDN